jgi:hypothetical protein
MISLKSASNSKEMHPQPNPLSALVATPVGFGHVSSLAFRKETLGNGATTSIPQVVFVRATAEGGTRSAEMAEQRERKVTSNHT